MGVERALLKAIRSVIEKMPEKLLHGRATYLVRHVLGALPPVAHGKFYCHRYGFLQNCARKRGAKVSGDKNWQFSVLPIMKGDIYVDVGASFGRELKKAWQETEGNVKIVAIEPSPAAMKRLERNVKIWKIRATLVNKACYSRKTKMTLVYLTNGSNASLRKGGYELSPARGKSFIEIQTDTLDHILESVGIEKVDFLKLDVEGAEAEVLKGFSKFGKGTKFYIEYHKFPPYDLLKFLEKNRINIRQIDIWPLFDGREGAFHCIKE